MRDKATNRDYTIRSPRLVKPDTQEAPHIMMVAGEPSGDALGAELITALRTLTEGRVKITGMGGDAMEAQGLKSLFPISDTSVMGYSEIVPAIPRILRRVRDVADFAVETRPDVVVLIDSPGFTHRVARRIARLAPDLRLVKFVAPQVWASRPGRAAKLAEIVDCVLTIFPFEAPWFEREGLPAQFVGYSVVERADQMRGGAVFRTRHAIPADTPVLLLLPGSRRTEIRMMMPLLRACAHRMRRRIPGLHVVIPVVPHVREVVEAAMEGWSMPIHVVGQEEKFASFDAANAALAVSGTVTTELALARVPMVVIYQMSWLTEQIAKRIVNVEFITMINLVAGVGVVPEFIQRSATVDSISDELMPLLSESDVARRQVDRQARALSELGLGGEKPSHRAAKAILDMMNRPLSPIKLRCSRSASWRNIIRPRSGGRLPAADRHRNGPPPNA